MKSIIRQLLPGLAGALLLLCSPASWAGTTYTYTATAPQTGGDWSHDFTFPQFDLALGSLDSIHLTASFDLTTSATFFNTDKSSKVFWFQAGSLLSVSLPDALAPLEEDSFGPRQHYKLPGFGSADYGPFTTTATVELTLTGAQLASFLGTGTVDLSAQAQTQTLLSDLDGGGNKIDVDLSSSSNATLTLEYLDSPVPEPSTGALLGLALGGLSLRFRKARGELKRDA